MGSQVRVAVVYSGARYFGGVETYLENLAKHVDPTMVDVRLYSLGEWELCARYRSLGRAVTVLSGDRIRWKTVSELASAFIGDGVEVVVTQGTVSNFYGRLAARKASLTVATFVHSDPVADYPRQLIRAAYGVADRFTESAVTRYLAVSPYLAAHLLDRGVDPDRVQVISTGVTTLESVADEICGPETQGETVIVSVGRLQPVKNYPALVRALSTLTDHRWRLRIYGEGPERTAILLAAAESGVADRVELAGWEPDLARIMGGANLYVQPSLSEGFGLAVVEAMAAGVPVVVTPVGNLAHLVEDGVTGLVSAGTDESALAEVLDRALSDVELRNRCAGEALQSAVEIHDVSRWSDAVSRALVEISEFRP